GCCAVVWVTSWTSIVVTIYVLFFFSSRRRHTRSYGDWSSDVCSSDLAGARRHEATLREHQMRQRQLVDANERHDGAPRPAPEIHVRRVTLAATSARSRANGAAYAARFARTTRSTAGSEATG